MIWSYLRPDDRMQWERIGVVRHPERGEERSEALALASSSSSSHLVGALDGAFEPVEPGTLRADGPCNALLPRPRRLRRRRSIARRARRSMAPFPIQVMVIEDATDGPRHARAIQDRLGQDPRLRDPDRGAARPRRADSVPRRSSSCPRASSARQVKDDFTDIAKAKGLKVKAVYGGTNVKEQAKGVGRRPTS